MLSLSDFNQHISNSNMNLPLASRVLQGMKATNFLLYSTMYIDIYYFFQRFLSVIKPIRNCKPTHIKP